MTIDLSKASPIGAAIAQSILDRKASEPRLAVSFNEARAMLGDIGDSLMTRLISADEIKSFVVGGRRVIYAASLYDYLIEAALRSHPADAPPLKLSRPVHEALAERKARGLPKGLKADAIVSERKAEKAKAEPFRSAPLA